MRDLFQALRRAFSTDRKRKVDPTTEPPSKRTATRSTPPLLPAQDGIGPPLTTTPSEPPPLAPDDSSPQPTSETTIPPSTSPPTTPTMSPSPSPSLFESLPLAHVPPTHTIHATFFTSVTNSSFLHTQLLSRNPAFDYAFIDASAIISRRHLLSAIFNALTTILDGTLISATPHSEVVLALGGSNNIAEAYRRWGISPSTKNLIVVKIVSPSSASQTTKEEIWNHLTSSIEGTPVALTDEEIAKATDWGKVKKYYALNSVPMLAKVEGEERKRKEMERLAVMRMALRGL